MAQLQTVSTARLAGRFRNSTPSRILAISGAAGLAGALFYSHTEAIVGGQPVWLMAGLLYTVSIGLTATLIFRFLPKLGHFMELTAVSRLLLASAGFMVPDFAVMLTTAPLLNATMVIGGALLIRSVARAKSQAGLHFGPRFLSKQQADVPGRL